VKVGKGESVIMMGRIETRLLGFDLEPFFNYGAEWRCLRIHTTHMILHLVSEEGVPKGCLR
jgi:hypothetical protein